MKKTSLQVLIVTLLFGCSMISCQDNKKGSSPGMENGQYGVATVTLEDGRQFEFEASNSFLRTVKGKKFMIGLTYPSNRMYLYLDLAISGESIKEGEYDGELIIKQLVEDDILQEEYSSENAETGGPGNATITLTEVTDNQISGTFSGTLYSKSGKKAVIEEGKFSIQMESTLQI